MLYKLGEIKINTEEIIISIIAGLASAIITGIVTFLNTKYNYHRNRPLDKYERVYNRVYYPIYELLMSLDNQEQIDYKEVIIKCESRILKYKKHVDRATLVAFDDFKNSSQNLHDAKSTYQKFKTNILENNVKLRIALGYLEPGLIGMYKFATKADKLMANFALVVSTLVSAYFIYYLFKERDKIITSFMLIFVFLSFWYLFRLICFKVRTSILKRKK